MITTVRPEVWLGGTPLSGWAADLATQPVVLDGLSIEWGRDEYLQHSSPSTCKVSIIDASGTLAHWAATRQLIGRNLVITVTDGAGWGFWTFQGRITTAEATVERGAADNPVPEVNDVLWRVDLAAADKTADLGQIMQPPHEWPEQPMIERAVNLRNSSLIAGIGEFYFYPGSTDLYCAPLKVTDKDNLALCKALYYSMGDTYSYLPDENVVRYLHRRSYEANSYLVRYDDGTIGIETGARTYDSRRYIGGGLYACDLEADDGTNFVPNSVLTRVEGSFKDYTQGHADAVSVLSSSDEGVLGRRTLTFDTWLNYPTYVADVVRELLARGTVEGSVPRHPTVTYDSRRVGGFRTLAQAQMMLLAGETQSIYYLSGSQHQEQWTPGVPPFFAILGGTITWEDQRWLVSMNLQRHNRTNSTSPPTIDPSLDPADFDPSITSHDLRWLTDGVLHEPNLPVLPSRVAGYGDTELADGLTR